MGSLHWGWWDRIYIKPQLVGKSRLILQLLKLKLLIYPLSRADLNELVALKCCWYELSLFIFQIQWLIATCLTFIIQMKGLFPLTLNVQLLPTVLITLLYLWRYPFQGNARVIITPHPHASIIYTEICRQKNEFKVNVCFTCRGGTKSRSSFSTVWYF